MDKQNIDIHCHSLQRPYAKSFDPNYTDEKNPWYKTVITWFKKWMAKHLTFAKFTQSDFTSHILGKHKIIFISLYPIEKNFFQFKYAFLNKLGINTWIGNFVTSLGKKRIVEVKNTTDYWDSFKKEYHFLKQTETAIVKIDDVNYASRVVSSFAQLQQAMLEQTSVHYLYIIPTIEGMHILNTALLPNTTETQIMQYIKEIKENYPMLFVSIAHHFWNGLCGHAPSLNSGFSKWFLDQSNHIDEGFTPIGWKVVDALLQTHNGRRIYIDVKHKSVKARKEYYNYLDIHYKGEDIPIIVSHGSCNGWASFTNEKPTKGLEKTASILKAESLNIYDEELIKIAETNGIFGLQLDKKRLVNPVYKIPVDTSYLVWNQIEHIVRLLDKNEMLCWHILTIGSDNDGIVSPVSPFFTNAEFPTLRANLKNNLMLFLENYTFYHTPNNIDAETIMDKLFYDNAWNFLKRYW
jgi:hypothetical protein